MGRKALIVGLDGATWDILTPIIENGYMPNIKRLMSDGFSGEMESTLPPITPVAWTSFMTGVNPGKHGISGFAHPKPTNGGHEFSLNDSQDIDSKTMWEYLSDRGRSVISLNLPMTYPPFNVDGALVSGLLTPNARRQFTYPEELQADLLDRDLDPFIDHVAGELPNCESKREYKQRVDDICDLVEKKFEQVYFIDKRYDWDVFFFQIQETDAIQHFLLGFYEEGHDWFDEEMRDYIYERFYGMIDERIGEVFDTVGENALKLVVSDHGFQTCDRVVYLGNWLESEGFAEASTTGFLYRRIINNAKKLDIFGLRRRLSIARKVAKKKESITLDWNKSDAISIGAGNNPIVPIYILKSGARRDAVRDEIASSLKQFTDPENGNLVVDKVIIGDDVYSGPHSDEMPDILVKGAPGYTLRTTRHADEPTIIDLVEKTNRPGVHHRTGMFAGKSDVTRGDGHVEHGQLEDVFPTLLYYLGEPIPSYVDGEILNVFSEEFRETNELEQIELPLGREIDARTEYSEADEEDVKDTLSQLGYID